MAAYFSKMNYSIKVVTFNVKPEVRNGLESEIMFSQCFQYKGTDQLPLERGLENKLLLQHVGISKAIVNE